MAIVLSVKESTYVRLDEGPYVAKITAVEMKESDKKFNDQDFYLQFTLNVENPQVDGEEHAPVDLVYQTSAVPSTHEKNKLGNLLKAVGYNLVTGDSVDIEEVCIGKRLRIIVKDKVVRDAQTGVEKVFSQVTDVLVLKKQQPAKPVTNVATKQQPKQPVKQKVQPTVDEDSNEVNAAVDDAFDDVLNM